MMLITHAFLDSEHSSSSLLQHTLLNLQSRINVYTSYMHVESEPTLWRLVHLATSVCLASSHIMHDAYLADHRAEFGGDQVL